jgi:hypothetical protein
MFVELPTPQGDARGRKLKTYGAWEQKTANHRELRSFVVRRSWIDVEARVATCETCSPECSISHS